MINDFIHQTRWTQLPSAVQGQAKRCLLDTLGAAAGGSQTEMSRISCLYAAAAHGGQGAHLWFDGRELSPPGAALANGITIDALDIHDGYTITKGHAGAALVPALIATLSMGSGGPVSGQELLASLVVGYEIALRAGTALHATVSDYHTSGAWNALGCAAVTARRLALSEEQTGHALGIAEYHGPRSQMMRCIDAPTMVKDGSGWGAMAGVSAGMLAGYGFTGAPAVTVLGDEVAHIWADLGRRWLILEQYFKPYAVCRWAQPAIAGALRLRDAHQLHPAHIRTITVESFHQAIRLSGRAPANTEEAQYSLPFPVAAALIHGQLGPRQLSGAGLLDEQVLRLSRGIELVESGAFSDRFPAERFARVLIETVDGRSLDSGPVEATWGAEQPPSDQQLKQKFRWLAGEILTEERTRALEAAVWDLPALADAAGLLPLLLPPAEAAPGRHTNQNESGQAYE